MTMTPTEFKNARQTLNLSAAQLGAILDTNPRTIRKWEDSSGTRSPNPIACRVIDWMTKGGFRPPQWPVNNEIPLSRSKGYYEVTYSPDDSGWYATLIYDDYTPGKSSQIFAERDQLTSWAKLNNAKDCIAINGNLT